MNQPTLSMTSMAPLELSKVGAQDWVVLLHGLFASRQSMRLLEDAIQNAGYAALNWGYATWWRSTEYHVNRLLPLLAELQSNAQVRSINFVTHSMGGILVRSALHGSRFTKVQRMVMLSPPNRGSHLTRIKLGPFAWLVPSLADLSEAPDSLPNRLQSPNRVEIGVIAASHDFVVPVANTSLENQRDHCVVASSHFRLPREQAAIRLVLQFLQTGKFSTYPHSANFQSTQRSAA
jgi:pimeloyl-ACP methyl ester carboxylesterase